MKAFGFSSLRAVFHTILIHHNFAAKQLVSREKINNNVHGQQQERRGSSKRQQAGQGADSSSGKANRLETSVLPPAGLMNQEGQSSSGLLPWDLRAQSWAPRAPFDPLFFSLALCTWILIRIVQYLDIWPVLNQVLYPRYWTDISVQVPVWASCNKHFWVLCVDVLCSAAGSWDVCLKVALLLPESIFTKIPGNLHVIQVFVIEHPLQSVFSKSNYLYQYRY